MPVMTAMLIALTIGALAAGGIIAANYARSAGPRKLNRAERLRLERAETTLDKIYDAACDERELGTGGSPFADIVIDEVRTFRKSNKELGS